MENLRPSTDYQLTVVAESRAGVGQQTGPIRFRTLDKQIPEFTIDGETNRTCPSDDSCLISWNIQSDGGAPILRTEIAYTQVREASQTPLANRISFSLQANEDNSVDPQETPTPPISLPSPANEYELTRLKADTSYIVTVKLYNEAGVAEREFHIRTSSEKNGKRRDRLQRCITFCRHLTSHCSAREVR